MSPATAIKKEKSRKLNVERKFVRKWLGQMVTGLQDSAGVVYLVTAVDPLREMLGVNGAMVSCTAYRILESTKKSAWKRHKKGKHGAA